MKAFYLIILLLAGFVAPAQQTFFNSVKVEYEKTIYAHQMVKEIDLEWYDWIKDKTPPTKITYFELIADTAHSLFKPGKEVASGPRNYITDFGETKNTVYTDFRSGTATSLKPVFEETFFISDSLSRIKWKLTADTRNIAGFECRKAIGIIDDSIGVFAFYADELMIPGGPESVHGLPGLILGMGIPRLHATWFATKVEVNGVDMRPVKAPVGKGKKVDKGSLYQQLEKVLKSWGKHGDKLIVNFII